MTLDRRTFLQIAAAGFGAAAIPMQIHAKVPLTNRQAPGYYRFELGDIEVTALNDGFIELDPSLYPKADKAEAQQLLETAHRAPKIPTSINAFAVNTGNALILVDTGASNGFGPGAGKMPSNLASAGIDPAAVDIVFLTHMHPDHANGLINAEGAAVFPNAELVVTEKEFAFWHDDGMMSQAPAEMKPFFQAARKAVKPYAARMRKITDGEVAPGLTAMAAPGHTPGHAMLRVGSGKDGLLIWGDIIHTASIQLPHPEWAISFDTDPDLAISSRKAVFDRVVSEGVMIAGAHLDFPGVGFVSRNKSGYDYHPSFWSPTL